MILGVGIDSVDIKRFDDWKQFSKKTLQRIFSSEEIEYCLFIPAKSAERFAVRFAMREAFFKAFSSAFPEDMAPFLTICKQLIFKKTEYGSPYLIVNWKKLIQNNKKMLARIQTEISCSHTQKIAMAIVILQAG